MFKIGDKVKIAPRSWCPHGYQGVITETPESYGDRCIVSIEPPLMRPENDLRVIPLEDLALIKPEPLPLPG